MPKEELSPALDLSAAWLEWLAMVDTEERAAVADLLEAVDITEDDGLVRFCQAVMVSLMRGLVSPPIAAELRKWATTIFAAKAAQAIPNAIANGGTVTIAQTLQATIERQRTMSLPAPTWDVIEAEPEKVPLPLLKENS